MPNVKINEQNNKGTRYIARNKGILLANKQIYQEATSVLFGKNLWGAIPEFERIWSFWRCDSYKCQPVERPCYVRYATPNDRLTARQMTPTRPETAANIKHLLIIVNVRGLPAESHNLKRNLYMMVDTLKGIGIQLQTLKVRYWTQYGGEVEALREDLEGPLPPGIPPRPIMMKASQRRNHSSCLTPSLSSSRNGAMTNTTSPLELHHRTLRYGPTQRDQHQALPRHQHPRAITPSQGRRSGSQHSRRSTTSLQGRAHQSPHLCDTYLCHQEETTGESRRRAQEVRPTTRRSVEAHANTPQGKRHQPHHRASQSSPATC